MDIDILFSDGTFTPLRKALKQSLNNQSRGGIQSKSVGKPLDFPKISDQGLPYGFLSRNPRFLFAIHKLLMKVLDLVWTDFFSSKFLKSIGYKQLFFSMLVNFLRRPYLKENNQYSYYPVLQTLYAKNFPAGFAEIIWPLRTKFGVYWEKLYQIRTPSCVLRPNFRPLGNFILADEI